MELLIAIGLAVPIVLIVLAWMRRHDPAIAYTREGDRWDEIERAWQQREWDDEG